MMKSPTGTKTMLMPSWLRVVVCGVGVKLGVGVKGRVGMTLGVAVSVGVDVGERVLVSLGLGALVGVITVVVGNADSSTTVSVAFNSVLDEPTQATITRERRIRIT
jgi:cell shape-determining protein MreD